MHEYEVETTVHLRFAAESYAEAVVKRQRLMAVLGEGATVVQRRTGMIVRFANGDKKPHRRAALSRAVRVEVGARPLLPRRRKVLMH